MTRETLKEAKVNQKRYSEAYEAKAIPKQQLDDQESLVRQLEGTVTFDQGQVATAQTQVDYCAIRVARPRSGTGRPFGGLMPGTLSMRRTRPGMVVGHGNRADHRHFQRRRG